MSIESTEVSERPKASFDDLPLSDEVRQALSDMEYQHPTPVQIAVWAPAADGRDIVVQARTGTGKTAAFGLPLVDRIVRRNKSQVQALVLCPTRELALQVSRELTKLGARKEINTVAVYGGAPMQRQVDQLSRGPHIVVGTPGRVLDHLRRGTFDADAIRALVLDESDEMLSMGFERELTAIIDHLPAQRQTLLFSATVPPDIERMARNKLREPEFVILSSDQVGALEILHFVYWVTQNKLDALVQIIDIEDPESAIVFCNTKKQTETVAAHLKRHGFEADWLNGDLPQADREKVMRKTREGRCRFLVATDVAARGIDISHLTHVINFDFPLDAEGYVHRTGRTGRAGRTGTALALVAPAEVGALYILRLTYKIRPIERQLPSEREQQTRREADIVASLAQTFATRGNDEAHRGLARRLLCHDDAEAILAGILCAHLTTNPELPELSESRRRGKSPPPAATSSDGEARSQRRKRRGRDTAPEAPEVKRAEVHNEPAPEPPARAPRASRPQPAPAAVATPAPAAREKPAPAAQQKPAPAAREKPAPAAQQKPVPPIDHDDDDDEDGAGDDRASAAGGETVELHVDAGRRDGARVRMFKSILADAGIDPEHVRRVRVRERYCFVDVDLQVRDPALEALNAATIPDDTQDVSDDASSASGHRDSNRGKRKLRATISERSQSR